MREGARAPPLAQAEAAWGSNGGARGGFEKKSAAGGAWRRGGLGLGGTRGVGVMMNGLPVRYLASSAYCGDARAATAA